LNAHSEACFALAAQREAGAAPAAEAHFQRFLAHRALPLIQSCAVLMTLNSLGTVVRMALALSSPRWARNSSVLGYLPMLHSISRDGPAPVTALRVPEDVARRICHLVLPCFALVRLPMMFSLFVSSTSPSRREWCVRGPRRPTRLVRSRRASLPPPASLGSPCRRGRALGPRRGAERAVVDSSLGPWEPSAGRFWVPCVPQRRASRMHALPSCVGWARWPQPHARCAQLSRWPDSLAPLRLCARYISNHVRMFTTAVLVETATSTILLEGAVWLFLHRLVVWPPAMVLCSSLGDIISHHMLVRARPPLHCNAGIDAAAMARADGALMCADCLRPLPLRSRCRCGSTWACCCCAS
jgi:hypothetical protein